MQTELFPVTTEYKDISIEELLPQVTHSVNPTPQMVASVKKYGILQPIILCDKTLIAGRRRVLAAKMAGLEVVPARIFVDTVPNVALSLVENEQRRQNPLSDLHSVEALLNEGKDEKGITAATGMTPQRIRKILSVRNLSPVLRKAFEDGIIKYSVASIAAKKPKRIQEKLVDLLAEEGVLRVKDVHQVCRVERKVSVSSLPDSLFVSATATWKVDALKKLRETRREAETDADQQWLDKLDKLIEELEI